MRRCCHGHPPESDRPPSTVDHPGTAFEVAVLLGLLVLLGGCGGRGSMEASGDSVADVAGSSDSTDEVLVDEVTDDEGGAAAPIDLTRLTTGTWRLRFGRGPEGDVVPVDGSDITITITIPFDCAVETITFDGVVDGERQLRRQLVLQRLWRSLLDRRLRGWLHGVEIDGDAPVTSSSGHEGALFRATG